MTVGSFTILADGCAFPEGPVFTSDGSLWWVEIEGGCLGCWRDGVVTRVAVGARPNGLAQDAAGRLWICDAGEGSLRRFDPDTGKTVTIVAELDGVPLGKPNDLAFDPAGNLLFTCPNDARTEPSGYVCCLAPDGGLTRVAEGLYFPNGIAFTPKGDELIVAETYRHRLWRGRWEPESRRWLEPKPWIEVGGPIGPDGLAFSADGTLYVAVFGQGFVKIIEADGSMEELPLPGRRPTNVALDPTGRLGLVVTEAEHGLILSGSAVQREPALFAGYAT